MEKTSMLVPARECAFLLGDNSTHDRPDPWGAALAVVHALPPSEHYTVRKFNHTIAEEREAVLRFWEAFARPGQPAPSLEPNSDILIISRILADGGDENAALASRGQAAGDEFWHDGPPARGLSALGVGGRYILMSDIPKPLLEEVTIGVVTLTSAEEGSKACELAAVFEQPLCHDIGLDFLAFEIASEVARHLKYESLIATVENGTETETREILAKFHYTRMDAGNGDQEKWALKLYGEESMHGDGEISGQ